jgi:hypothetical protein
MFMFNCICFYLKGRDDTFFQNILEGHTESQPTRPHQQCNKLLVFIIGNDFQWPNVYIYFSFGGTYSYYHYYGVVMYDYDDL